mmetsp:Transcript_120667/g.348662  ORF Transcript_120667/g.348662 Transcript_120667/m.348662 type:complete len:173 (+) Transcript_120667:99-617(+)
MVENKHLPRVVKVKSTVPVKDDLEAFDFLSRFLAAEKAKQLSQNFVGQAYVGSSSQIWNDLRLACNSLLDQNDQRREPVAAWKDASAMIEDESGMPENDDLKEDINEVKASTDPLTPMQEDSASDGDSSTARKKEEKRSKKKEKKEAKKAAKKAKKSAKKEKKKRKKGEVDT